MDHNPSDFFHFRPWSGIFIDCEQLNINIWFPLFNFLLAKPVSYTHLYLQLMERIQRDIIAGVYQPGDKLPSVRDLALEAAVNPNTMQKALSELERSGLVYSQRTSGRFITEDTEMLTQMKKELATEHIQEFFQKMEQLGFSRAELLTLVTKAAEGEN